MNNSSSNIRTNVSFRADFDQSDGNGLPPGSDLANYLADEFAERGLMLEARSTTDDSHVFNVISGSRKFGLLLGLIEDDEREWLILSFSKLSRMRRMFGARDDDEYAAMLAAVDEVLQADDRFNSIRWYTMDEWQNDPIDSWGSLPFETIGG